MKKSDVAMIILIASISVLTTYFVANSMIGGLKTEAVNVKTAEPITAEVIDPDPKIFNSEAINPTVRVEIGGTDQSQ